MKVKEPHEGDRLVQLSIPLWETDATEKDRSKGDKDLAKK